MYDGNLPKEVLKKIGDYAFPVMGEKGWVELQDVMGSDLAIVNAARVSFLGESKGPENDEKLLRYLLRHGHTSPFEQAEIKLRVRAPVVTWWQWVRHRTWHVNAQSGRYTPFQDNDFMDIHPAQWRLQSASNKQGSDGTLYDENDMLAQQLTHEFQEHCERSFRLYQKALDAGVAKEQARLFLPFGATFYIWVLKVDLHNLLHFLRLRMDDHAQFEIRIYAEVIWKEIVKPLFPWTAKAFEDYVLEGKD